MGNLQIDVLGTSFTIKANEDTAYLNKLLGYYKGIIKQIEEKGELSDPIQISALAGITLCDELYKEKSQKIKIEHAIENNSADAEAERITRMMIEKIESVLK